MSDLVKKFVLYRNTKDRCESEREEVLMEQMEEQKEAIEFDRFKTEVEGWEDVARNLGYDDLDFFAKDWSLGFFVSRYGGRPCRMLEHTECDFIFLLPKDAENFRAAFEEDLTLLQKQRATGYGPNHTPT